MQLGKYTSAFLNWKEKNLKGKWFSYIKIDLQSGTFFISADKDGKLWYYVIHQGEVVSIGRDEAAGRAEYERAIRQA